MSSSNRANQGDQHPPSEPSAQASELSQDSPSEQSTQANPTNIPLPLPGPSDDTHTTKLDMSSGGSTVKLDHMGPLVVNKDGTLSRISNWGEMSEIERQNTLRILGKRNMLRREALEKEGNE